MARALDPFARAESFTLYVGDCRDVLAQLPDESVDSVVTDPPYGTTSLKWDVPVEGWLEQVERVLRPSGSVWIFGSLRSLAPLVAAADRHALGPWRFAQDIIWEKHNGSGFHADRFRRVHEQAIQLYRGRWEDVYRNVQTTLDARAKTIRRKERPTHTGAIENSTYTSHDGGPRLQRSVLAVRSTHGSAIHPTQKPEGIIRPLVSYSTPPGGVVLDPFAGSLTTGVVARDLGFRALLIEIDEKYASTGLERFQQTSLLALGG